MSSERRMATEADRKEISRGIAEKLEGKVIAARIGRSPGTGPWGGAAGAPGPGRWPPAGGPRSSAAGPRSAGAMPARSCGLRW